MSAASTVLVTGATSRVGRLVVDELSPDEFRREAAGTWPPAVVEMLLSAWQATLGQPAFVTTAIRGIVGSPPRSFSQWAVDHGAEFTKL